MIAAILLASVIHTGKFDSGEVLASATYSYTNVVAWADIPSGPAGVFLEVEVALDVKTDTGEWSEHTSTSHLSAEPNGVWEYDIMYPYPSSLQKKDNARFRVTYTYLDSEGEWVVTTLPSVIFTIK